MARRVFTNLNLHEHVPVRARPRLGEWGSQLVATTTGKKAMRVLVPILLTLAIAAVVTLGYFAFREITSSVGL